MRIANLPIGVAVMTINESDRMKEIRGIEDYGHDTHVKVLLQDFYTGEILPPIYRNVHTECVCKEGFYFIPIEGEDWRC